MSGANYRTIQALGRWKEPKILQRYAHLSKEHLTEALEKLQPLKSDFLERISHRQGKLRAAVQAKWCRRGDLNPHDG
jgi:hypothetical protein